MNVSLTKELERYVNSKVKGGLYHTASEVVREGLRLLDERDKLYAFRLQELRADVNKGIAELNQGKGKSFQLKAAKKRLQRRTRTAKRTRKP